MLDSSRLSRRRAGARTALRFGLAALYLGIGLVHLARPEILLPIVPDWVPQPRAVILITGLCEIAGGIGLLTTRWRRSAGIMLALYAVCVLPANIRHALDGIVLPGLPTSWWYHGPRLAFQPVLVWAALYAGGSVDWPFGRAGPASAEGGDHHGDDD